MPNKRVPSKPCKTCHEVKPIEQFAAYSTAAKSGYRNTCKPCFRAYMNAYYQTARGKEVRKKSAMNYMATSRGQDVRRNAAERLKDFLKTPEGKAWSKERRVKYKETRQAWLKSPKGIASLERQADRRREWLKTPKGRAYQKREDEKQKQQSLPFKRRLLKFGWSLEEYNAALAAQNGRCAICGHKPLKRLAIDHCHITNSVRGLLCSHCNLSLGLLQDDVHLLLNACEYLINYEQSFLQNTGDS